MAQVKLDINDLNAPELAAGPYRHAGTSTKSKKTLTGLLSGQLYFIRARGENSAGPGAFTNPVQQRAS